MNDSDKADLIKTMDRMVKNATESAEINKKLLSKIEWLEDIISRDGEEWKEDL